MLELDNEALNLVAEGDLHQQLERTEKVVEICLRGVVLARRADSVQHIRRISQLLPLLRRKTQALQCRLCRNPAIVLGLVTNNSSQLKMQNELYSPSKELHAKYTVKVHGECSEQKNRDRGPHTLHDNVDELDKTGNL
jgi:hypothetical protein